jgi:ATP-binding cassette subfamily B (MDR/TAP) protein 1
MGAKVVPTDNVGEQNEAADDASTPKAAPPGSASFLSLFRFASGWDMVLMCVGVTLQLIVGCGFSALNIVFGEILDDLANPSGSVMDNVSFMLYIMFTMAGIFGVTALFAMSSIPYAAAKITNKLRMAYLQAVLRQDSTFFDLAQPGQVVSAMSVDTLDFENGISVKFGEGLQAMAGCVSGLAVAFYFSWRVSLVCATMVPVMAAAFGIMLSAGVDEDGVTGKAAFEGAANVASENLSSMRTVASFNGEVKAAEQFEGRLVEAEKAAISQGNKLGWGTGLMWCSFFWMMGIAFWYGGTLVVGSTRDAMEAHPIPVGFVPANMSAVNEYSVSYSIALETCRYRNIGAFGKGPLKDYSDYAFEVCACGLPWKSLQTAVSSAEADWAKEMRELGVTGDDIVDPMCGCGFGRGEIGIGSSPCVTGGQMTAVFFCVMIAGMMLAMIGPAIKAITDAQMAAHRLYTVIDRRPEIDPSALAKGKKIEVTGRVALDAVHFKYPTGARKIFNDINLDIAPGETVALVGESGSGKSTIARLLSRFYDVDQGGVLIDGVDVKQLDLVHLRDQIGVVSQEPLLFDVSVEENIRLGKPGGATKEEIVEAAKAANAHEFIKGFPEGYNTVVGARGSKLSGGQKQRIAIARALVRKPRILVLDEATSALDNESEKIVQQAIDDLCGGAGGAAKITTIIIAHRLSTVRSADRIVVLGSKEGTSTAMGSTIVEVGSHDELMAKENGLYRALVGSSGEGEGPKRASQIAVEDPLAKAESVKTQEIVAAAKKEPTDEEREKLEAKQVEEDFKKVDKARLWSYTRPERKHYVVGLFACFVNGVVWPMCGGAFALVLTAFSSSDLDYARTAINICALSFGGLGLMSLIAQWAQTYLFEILGERMTRRLRTDYFRALMRQDMGWFDEPKNALGVLTARLTVDIKLIRLTAGQGTGASIQQFTSLITGFVVALIGAWQFALAFVGTMPLLALSEAINWAMMQGGDTSAKKQLGEISGLFGEYVQGIREVQSFSLEGFITEGASAMLDAKILAHSRKAAIGRGVSAMGVQVIQLGVYALAFWVGAKMLDGDLIDYETFNMVLWSMGFGASGMGLAANWVAQAAKGKAAATRVFELLDRKSPIDARPWNPDGSERTAQVPAFGAGAGEIELRDVRFAYPSRKTARVFDGLSLTIPAGKTAALIGSSGSGKSTVMALLERFYDPAAAVADQGDMGDDDKPSVKVESADEERNFEKEAQEHGTILLDGVDIRTLDVKYLRSLVGMVGQEPVLFNTSVANNIEFGRPGASREEIIAAAKAAHAHEFISKFAGGYDYNVGNRGKKVSGGQKQRIALARTILKDPKILLLDEATSALDNESEKIVQASLDELLQNKSKNRTTIVIAHRLSTIRNADCIYVLENKGDGAVVVEQGSHDELIEKDGKYRMLLEAYS